MILDFNNLTLDQSKEYTKCYHEFQSGYNDLIEKLTKSIDYESNPTWLFSTLLSRNVYQSPLVLQCAKLYYIRYLLNNGLEISKIIIDDRHVGEILKKALNDTLIIINGVRRYPAFLYKIKQTINIALTIFYGIRLKSQFRMESVDKNKEIIILDTFFLESSKVAKKYIDRYYTNINNYISSEKKEQIYWCPTILTNLSGKDLNAIIENSKIHKFIFKHDFLGISDYLKAVVYLKNQKSGFNERIGYEGFDISSLIKNNHESLKYSGYISVLNYLFVKRLKEQGVKLKLFIDWNENQPIDKSIIKGIRDYYPKCRIKGYQSYYIDRMFNFFLSPTEYELGNGVTPETITVTGNGLVNYVDRFKSGIKVRVGPALRYNIEGEIPEHKYKGAFTLLVFLNIIREESINTINIINYANIKDCRIIFRPHPSHTDEDKNNFKKLVRINNCCFSTDPLISDIRQSDLSCGSVTSALFECMAYGLPAIVIGKSNGLTQIPIPEGVDINMRELIYTPSEFGKAVEEKINILKDKNYINIITKKIREDYFEKATQQNVSYFININ